jgi:hypothetical protein
MGMPKARVGVDKVPIICPTRDEQGAVARSVAALYGAIFAGNRLPIYVHASCVGYARVRTNSFKEARKYVDRDVVRGVLLDDDILVSDPNALYDAMHIADKNGWNIVAPYRTKGNQICLCKENGDMMSIEEFSKLKPYDHIPLAGLGFYYGDIPLNYEFHADGKPFQGEDLNFFYDNPGLKPRMAPIPLKHLKVIPI